MFINQQKLINYKEISKRQFKSTKIYANWLNVLIKRVVVQQFPLQRSVSRLKMAINYEVKCVVDQVVVVFVVHVHNRSCGSSRVPSKKICSLIVSRFCPEISNNFGSWKRLINFKTFHS